MRLVQSIIYFDDYYTYGSRLSGKLLEMIAPSGRLFMVEAEVQNSLVHLGWCTTPQDDNVRIIESGR